MPQAKRRSLRLSGKSASFAASPPEQGTSSKGEGCLNVAFLHLDLGIGGAEQLVVNAAVALQRKGHHIRILTSHHDPTHCFAETRDEGPLAPYVSVAGDWLPRQILGRFTALCAAIRMIYLALVVAFSPSRTGEEEQRPDVIFCDGVSAMIPFLRLFGYPVLFYCHFPDKLLCSDRRSFLKRIYRCPLDWIEETTTGLATVIAVNSRFTAQVFKEAFTRIGPKFDPAVIYPAINLESFIPPKAQPSGSSTIGPIVSLNRFERKKNIGLALEAFAIVRSALIQTRDTASLEKLKLFIAGGYDDAVLENKEYMEELKDKAQMLAIGEYVSFRPSISDQERATLLQDALCVLYTPDKEHFGIVPLEAMYAGSPVIAVASGGPLETIVDQQTGFLCEGNGHGFACAILHLVKNPELKKSMGKAGHDHVKASFGLEAFAQTLDQAIRQRTSSGGEGKGMMMKKGGGGLVMQWVFSCLIALLVIALAILLTVLGLNR